MDVDSSGSQGDHGDHESDLDAASAEQYQVMRGLDESTGSGVSSAVVGVPSLRWQRARHNPWVSAEARAGRASGML